MQTDFYCFSRRERIYGTAIPALLRPPAATRLKMRKVTFITCFMLLAALSGLAQTVTVNAKNMPLKKVLDVVEKQTGYVAFYERGMMNMARPVSIQASAMPLKDFLDAVMAQQVFTYRLADKTIALLLKEAPAPGKDNGASAAGFTVRGVVTDSRGKPVQGATVQVKGIRRATQTDGNGRFELADVPPDAALTVTCIGFREKTTGLNKRNTITIELETAVEELGGVTVNAGIVSRNKNTFTGATSTFTGNQLKAVGNGNIIQSLKTLDPSFIQIETSQFGSDPNRQPRLEIRGKSGITTTEVNDVFKNDPNQPLFILNGMETTLQKIVDLDINRVASVTILKDAASTALYGSRAANGVVVVETKRPVSGAINVSYTFDGRLDFPDLSSYNMMNATENLEFQRLADLFTTDNSNRAQQYVLDAIYNKRRESVLSGKDYSWLNVPLRNALTNGHNIYVDGGDEKLSFGVALNYKNLHGVMKGSGRQTYGGSIDLAYRHKKLNITNQLYINGNASTESPYGAFRTYVNVNPYFSYFDEHGNLNRERYLLNEYWGTMRAVVVSNPIYNALLNSKNKSSGFGLQNNLSLIYDISPDFRFSAGLQVAREAAETMVFVSPADTRFDNVDILRRGTYSKQQQHTMNYQGNVMLTYNKVLAKKHSITANLRSELQYNNSRNEGVSAEGFPDVEKFNPAFAFSYPPNSQPPYAENKYSRLNNLFSINYAFDNRYFLDFTYRLDGSSSFGSNKLFTQFTSAGLGWNLNREPFMKSLRNVDQLRLRANVGTTGNQNLGSFISTSVYNYMPGGNLYGLSYMLSQLGNPELDWQKTLQVSGGIDLSMFGRRLNATLNGYMKTTDPLIISAALPASSGITQLPTNIGALKTKGAEVVINYSPIFLEKQNIVWNLSLTGSIIKSEYAKIGDRLNYQNEKLLTESSLIRYRDGYNPDEVWAVRSLGIDPATGQEVFLTRDGNHSFKYDPLDIVPLGSSQPVVQGVIGSNLRIKGITLGVNIRYSIGAMLFNSALFNKVENISTQELENNQDKRALYERWKQPGDISSFRAINISADGTPMSSRFVQKESFLSGESISLGYQLFDSRKPFMRAIRAKSLRANAYMNDILRLSNIVLERGLDYPYTRSVSFSLNLTF